MATKATDAKGKIESGLSVVADALKELHEQHLQDRKAWQVQLKHERDARSQLQKLLRAKEEEVKMSKESLGEQVMLHHEERKKQVESESALLKERAALKALEDDTQARNRNIAIERRQTTAPAIRNELTAPMEQGINPQSAQATQRFAVVSQPGYLMTGYPLHQGLRMGAVLKRYAKKTQQDAVTLRAYVSATDELIFPTSILLWMA